MWVAIKQFILNRLRKHNDEEIVLARWNIISKWLSSRKKRRRLCILWWFVWRTTVDLRKFFDVFSWATVMKVTVAFFMPSAYTRTGRGQCVEKLLWVQIPLCRLKNFEQNVDFPYIIYVTRSKTWRSMKPLKIFTWNCWKAHHGKKDDQ